MPRTAIGTRSLRVGGATAAYHATDGNKGTVQRLGRWASDAFQGYVWEGRTLMRTLAARMLRAPWGPHMAALPVEVSECLTGRHVLRGPSM